MTKVKELISQFLTDFESNKLASRPCKLAENCSLIDISKQGLSNDELYRQLHAYAHQVLPDPLIKHRAYYSKEFRGFGEDAFHAMWYLLLKYFRPKTCLEIGVYRGQVVSLWALIAKLESFECEIHGISPFTSAGDGVSTYLSGLDYKADVLSHHDHFNLNHPSLHKCYSNEQQALEIISSKKWDLIYIDGSHDYEVVLSDFRAAKGNLAPQGIIVLDDSSALMEYNPPRFAFKGHPGPSQVAVDIASKEMKHISTIGHNNIFMNEI